MKALTCNVRAFLAIGLAVIIFPAVWLGKARGLEVPDIVTGATISLETLIVQFYFRKKEDG